MENITIELLNNWKKNPNINPLTKRKIKINGPTYKKLEKIFIVKIKKKHIAQTKSIIFNYIEFRKNKIDPILHLPLPINKNYNIKLFSFKYQWNPYNGERLKTIDPNGPLYFDPHALLHFFYTNRLKHLWNKNSPFVEGYYGDAMGNGPDFKIIGRGTHHDWYLFRLPITDEYLYKDHCHQSVTMGPTLTHQEINEIYQISKNYSKLFKNTYGYDLPNLMLMKQIYEDAISKNEEFDSILGDSIPFEEIKILKHNANSKAVNKLRFFK